MLVIKFIITPCITSVQKILVKQAGAFFFSKQFPNVDRVFS
jgi:hypothetical protein